MLYLIKRRGYWFRPEALGYTAELSDAGLFPEHEARSYLDVEDLSIHPAAELMLQARQDILRHQAAILRLQEFITSAGSPT